jgi:ankyrin repeat protein
LKFLHGKGYDLKKARKGNVTLIHLAVSNGNVEMMDYLINQGVSATTESEDLGAPLEWAIAYSQVAAAKFLFSKGCKMSN